MKGGGGGLLARDVETSVVFSDAVRGRPTAVGQLSPVLLADGRVVVLELAWVLGVVKMVAVRLLLLMVLKRSSSAGRLVR